MKKILHSLLIEFNFFIALCALALTGWFDLVLKGNYPVSVYLFNFFGSLATYNLLRCYQNRKDFFSKDNLAQLLIIGGSVVTSLYFFISFYFGLQLLYIFLILLVIVYKFNFIHTKNLRSYLYLKLPIIAFVWSMMGAGYGIMVHKPDIPLLELVSVCFMQFAFCTALAIPYDIFGLSKDIDIETIPKRYGVEKTLFLANFFIIFYFLFAFLTINDIRFVSASNIVAICSTLVIYFSGNIRNKYLQNYLIDGLLLFQFIVFYAMMK